MKPSVSKAMTRDALVRLLPRLLSGYPAVVVVLALHFLIAAAAVREKSSTYDEGAHVTAASATGLATIIACSRRTARCPRDGLPCRCWRWI